LAELCEARLKGDQVGSSVIELFPGKIAGRNLNIKIPTAGSISLILQSLMPVALAASPGVTINFDGGSTDTPFSPTLDYFRHVLLWFLKLMGIDLQIAVSRRGYYPKGGAQVAVAIKPALPKCLTITERGAPKGIALISSASSSLKARRVAERQIEAALATIEPLRMKVETSVDYASSISAGSALCIVAQFENTVVGSDSLGARGKMAEQVGREVATAIMEELASNGCLDRHMADQLLVYMALAGPGSCVSVSEITTHCRTNMRVIEQFLNGRFEVRHNFIRWTERLNPSLTTKA